MMIGVMQNLPELFGGVAVIILTWIVARLTMGWPIVGSKKYRAAVAR